MANSLYNDMQKNNVNPFEGFINSIHEMQKTFKGNPQETVQNLLNTGAMTQQQFNQFAQIANKIFPLIGQK